MAHERSSNEEDDSVATSAVVRALCTQHAAPALCLCACAMLPAPVCVMCEATVVASRRVRACARAQHALPAPPRECPLRSPTPFTHLIARDRMAGRRHSMWKGDQSFGGVHHGVLDRFS
jgi:hypothetical protein